MRFPRWRRSALCALLALFLLLPAAAPAMAASPPLLELWFEYDGRPLLPTETPQVRCFGRDVPTPLECRLFRSEDGRYWIERPAPGRYRLRVDIDDNRGNGPRQAGDLYRDYPFEVDERSTGPLLVALQRVMALQPAPRAGVPGEGGGCAAYPSHAADIVALFPTATVRLAWQPVSSQSRYHYKLWRVRCSDGMRLEQMLYQRTGAPQAEEPLPPNRPGEYYLFELEAVNAGQPVGKLLLDDGAGGVVSGYRFVVTDPLISRTWVYYLLAALALLFLGWLVAGALRQTPSRRVPPPDDIRPARRLRPVLVLLLLGSVALGGWVQREALPGWLTSVEEGVRSILPGRPEPALGQGGAAGLWHGVLVSASPKPFVGSGRRGELRIHFTADGAEVAFKRQGRWVAATDSAFQLQRSARGLTLLGYRRGDGVSELFSITVPDIDAPVWQLWLERMITRRDGEGRILATQRRKASGEARRVGPGEG